MAFIWNLYLYLNIALNILSALIFVYVILSWVARPHAPIYQFVFKIVNPFLTLFRPLSARIGRGMMIDITPWLAMLGIQVIRWALEWIFRSLLYL